LIDAAEIRSGRGSEFRLPKIEPAWAAWQPTPGAPPGLAPDPHQMQLRAARSTGGTSGQESEPGEDGCGRAGHGRVSPVPARLAAHRSKGSEGGSRDRRARMMASNYPSWRLIALAACLVILMSMII
jgi:hypothetical protein